MVANYSDATKLKHARQIATENGYFVYESTEQTIGKTGGVFQRPFWLLYRKAEPRNIFVAKRISIGGLLTLVKQTTGFK